MSSDLAPDVRVGGAFQPDATYVMTDGGFVGPTIIDPTVIGMNSRAAVIVLSHLFPPIAPPQRSGALCLFDSPTGTTITLPKPEVGMSFQFLVTTTLTSGQNIVQTDAPGTYLVGTVISSHEGATPSAAAGPKSFRGNGTTHTKLAMNGTTTGGIAGTMFTVTCVSPTQWFVSGNLEASGTIATPFAV